MPNRGPLKSLVKTSPPLPEVNLGRVPRIGERGYVVASGLGTVFSYVVHRHPPVPGRELPILIALIDLDHRIIPNRLTGPAAVCAIALRFSASTNEEHALVRAAA